MHHGCDHRLQEPVVNIVRHELSLAFLHLQEMFQEVPFGLQFFFVLACSW